MKKFLIGIAAILIVLFIVDLTVLKDNGMMNKLSQGDQYEKATNPDELPIGLNVGERVPDFTVNDLEGNPISLSDFHGKKVLLNFWASWCPPCRAEMPYMERIYQEYKKDDIAIVAVNMLTTEKSIDDVHQFIEDFELSFPIPVDEEGELGETFEIMSYPTSYFIDSDGVIRSKMIGTMDEEYMIKELQKLQ